MNRTCAIQHELGYHRTHGETTKHVFEASEFSMCNLICRMGVEGSFDPNGCGLVFRTRERARRVRGSGFLHDLSLRKLPSKMRQSLVEFTVLS